MANTVTVIPEGHEGEAAVKIHTNDSVSIETPSGQVFVSHNSVQGLFVTVRGEKESTTVKFNSKAVV